MMGRAILILALLAVGLWLGFEAIEGRGPFATPASRHLRAMKDRTELPPTYEQRDLSSIARLPAGRPVAEFARLESRGVSVEGYVQKIERARDGDLHLTVVPKPQAGTGRGDGYVSVEITPAWQKGSKSWTFDHLADAFGLDRSGHRAAGWRPRRVRLSGWLMYDFMYDVLPAWVVDRGHRVTGWEVHPVTRIELWDDAQQAFIDLPR
jgi:hypothetical protein